MKKIFLLLALVFICSGCTAYRSTGYEITPASNLVVTHENGEPLTECELIGMLCKVELPDGSSVEGKIRQIDELSLTLVKETPASEWKKARTVTNKVMKTDISDLSLKAPSKFRTFLIIIGASAIGFAAVAAHGLSKLS